MSQRSVTRVLEKHMSFDHATMINDPSQWPFWPVLPLVNRSKPNRNLSNTAVILDDRDIGTGENKVITLFHVNLFSLPQTEKDWKEAKRTEYSSVQELLADGWVVD